MKNLLSFFIVTALLTTILHGSEPAKFNTQWIPAKPEVSTYRSKGNQGEGLYQVSISRRDSLIEVYVNMISPGFTKTVSGTMTFDMRPLQSTAKIIVNNQVMMDTKCLYESNRLAIKTVMLPYNQTKSDSLTFVEPVIDFSQVPLLARTLELEKGIEYRFTSLNPQTNVLIPLTMKVLGEVKMREVDCYKVEINDFEDKSIYWVEKGSRRRVMRVEQPESHRTTELLQ